MFLIAELVVNRKRERRSAAKASPALKTTVTQLSKSSKMHAARHSLCKKHAIKCEKNKIIYIEMGTIDVIFIALVV